MRENTYQKNSKYFLNSDNLRQGFTVLLRLSVEDTSFLSNLFPRPYMKILNDEFKNANIDDQ